MFVIPRIAIFSLGLPVSLLLARLSVDCRALPLNTYWSVRRLIVLPWIGLRETNNRQSCLGRWMMLFVVGSQHHQGDDRPVSSFTIALMLLLLLLLLRTLLWRLSNVPHQRRSAIVCGRCRTFTSSYTTHVNHHSWPNSRPNTLRWGLIIEKSCLLACLSLFSTQQSTTNINNLVIKRLNRNAKKNHKNVEILPPPPMLLLVLLMVMLDKGKHANVQCLKQKQQKKKRDVVELRQLQVSRRYMARWWSHGCGTHPAESHEPMFMPRGKQQTLVQHGVDKSDIVQREWLVELAWVPLLQLSLLLKLLPR